MKYKKTVNRFGFDVHGGNDEHTLAVVRILVRDVENLVLDSRGPSATIVVSPHLMTPQELDHFVNDAVAELEAIRTEAKVALQKANSN